MPVSFRDVASVGWTKSQNTWFDLLGHTVLTRPHRYMAFLSPRPQHAAFTSAYPVTQRKEYIYNQIS